MATPEQNHQFDEALTDFMVTPAEVAGFREQRALVANSLGKLLQSLGRNSSFSTATATWRSDDESLQGTIRRGGLLEPRFSVALAHFDTMAPGALALLSVCVNRYYDLFLGQTYSPKEAAYLNNVFSSLERALAVIESNLT